MRVLVLLLLLTLGRSSPHDPRRILNLIRDYETLMKGEGGRGDMMADDDDDDDYDDDDDDDDEDCPSGCRCSPGVVQCSDKGLISVPEKIPPDTVMLDLQNNDITQIKEDDFKGLTGLYGLFLNNNALSKIHPRAFRDLYRLKLLYLSYNYLTEVPSNLPPNLSELRFHENKISRIKRDAFKGLRKLNVLELGANPLSNSGLELGAFNGMATLYLGLSEAKLTSVPKDCPSSMNEINLDYNQISKVEVEDFLRYRSLQRLGLGFNQIKSVENGSLSSVPDLRVIHLDHNRLKKIPPGLSGLQHLQVVFLHSNKIRSIGMNDFCPVREEDPHRLYTTISLFSNPVKYWEIRPGTFRCAASSKAIHMQHYRR
uniref:LRRNT domain-containing protein n=1 Tax=Periophthalmus magnuspinnatus TaxID=409849 RepID=A0A3B4AXP2_9GOBI